MARPQVKITKQVNSLGGVPPTEDGISILVVNPPAGYTTTGELKFKSLKDVENATITEAKDLANNFLLWEHLKDFFAQADGTEIHVLIVPEATTITNLFTIANANYVLLQNYLAGKAGSIKLLAVALKPAGTETNTGLSADLMTAIPLAQAFADAEYTRLRPIDIVLEGRKLTGTATSAQNLRTLASGNVSVMTARDATRKAALTTAGNTAAANYAAVGLLLGRIASVHVGRNIGRVKSGAMPVDTAEFSGGQKPYGLNSSVDYNEVDLDALSDKGYIFFDRYANKAGWFLVDDHTCTLATLSNAHITLNRALNKASRIAIATYIEELKDEVLVDSVTGQLAPIVVQTFQNSLQSAIENEMVTNPDPTREREISSAKVTIDPAQNVLATSKIVARLSITPQGIAREIETVVELVNPANN